MRVLVTGAGGFVGPYAIDALRAACGSDAEVIATSNYGKRHSKLGCLERLDVTDEAAVIRAIIRYEPTHVLHLAGRAPQACSADPKGAWELHVKGAFLLARSILAHARDCVLVHVGSGLTYGDSAKSGLALNESMPLIPIDQYTATKAAADLALGALSSRGLRCVRLRPFNHTGPGQKEEFVIASFAMQIARIEAGLTPPIIHVGNLNVERDFCDVRDVAKAYALVVRHGAELGPNCILNIASGIPRRIGFILDELLKRSNVQIAIEQDPQRSRPSELRRIVGDSSRIRSRLGWLPEYSLESTLMSVLQDCRSVANRTAQALTDSPERGEGVLATEKPRSHRKPSRWHPETNAGAEATAVDSLQSEPGSHR
jgi:GDP-4-dehydro-6-deoxy-D-mannose reductase